MPSMMLALRSGLNKLPALASERVDPALAQERARGADGAQLRADVLALGRRRHDDRRELQGLELDLLRAARHDLVAAAELPCYGNLL